MSAKEMFEELEYYFIQLLFNKNRMLLSYDNKDLYRALFDKYCKIYKSLPEDMDRLYIINSNFIDMITFKNQS